jgi:hypothetical protein
MTKLTVICRESGYESNILIYVVEVDDPTHEAQVQAAVQAARERDIPPDEVNDMEILFAFAGDLAPTQDWRD